MINDDGRLDFSILGMESHALYERLSKHRRTTKRDHNPFSYGLGIRQAASIMADSAITQDNQEMTDAVLAYLDGDESGVRDFVAKGCTVFNVTVYIEDEPHELSEQV